VWGQPLALLSGVRRACGRAVAARLPAVWPATRVLDRLVRRLPAVDHRMVPFGVPLRGAGPSGSHAPQVLRAVARSPGVRASDGGSAGPCPSGTARHRAGRTISPDLGATGSSTPAGARIRPGGAPGTCGRGLDRMAGESAPSSNRGDSASSSPRRAAAAPGPPRSLRRGWAGRRRPGRVDRRRTDQWRHRRGVRRSAAPGGRPRRRRAHRGQVSGRGHSGPLL
jgi:hypothetical protein